MGRGVSLETAAELCAQGVIHSEDPLNTAQPDYPLANKVYVCAHAERTFDHDVLVFADSDQVILNEPGALRLAPGEDAAVQPEPVLWVGAGSPDHENYALWVALLARHGIESPRFTRTVVGGHRIFGYWNSGLVAVRRNAGVFHRWQEIFEANWRESIWPKGGDHLIYLEQVSFALALMSSGARLRTLSRDYNYHIVIHDELPPDARLSALEDMTTMHYHKLIEKSCWQKPFQRVRSFRPDGERYDWLRREMRALSIGRPTELRRYWAGAGRKLRKAMAPSR